MGGEMLPIKETSKIKLEVDGRIVDITFHDTNDAWEKAVNYIMQGARRAIITETVTIEKT
jgi:hypothetical protein